ncbi:MAG: DUF4294 domain-containing protein [Bacteroidales bacterium]
MNKWAIILFSFFLPRLQAVAQQVTGKVLSAIIVDGDTIAIDDLSEVNIYNKMATQSSSETRQFSRLAKNVKKVYPYAKLAGIKFNEYSVLLADVKNEKEKRRMMKKAEDELEAQFGEDLKALTFSQGKILLKLVDRQTGNSSFDLVKEFRGKFVAFFWQSFASLFGYNLKVQYDPLGEDKDIELIVLMIENGTI